MQRKEFEDRVCNFIVQEALVQPGDGVVIGVSGGADSVALLRFFDHVKERLQISIRCVHVEHGIRGDESLRDQCFVEELCRTYGIAETSVAVGEQIAQAIKAHAAVEEMARMARYQALIQKPGKKRWDIRCILQWHIMQMIMARRCCFIWRVGPELMVCVVCQCEESASYVLFWW